MKGREKKGRENKYLTDIECVFQFEFSAGGIKSISHQRMLAEAFFRPLPCITSKQALPLKGKVGFSKT